MFFKSFLSILSLTTAATAMASDFTNNVSKPVLSQKNSSSDVNCQSLECQSRLPTSKNTVVLDSESTIVLRGEIAGDTVSETISKLLTSKGNTVTLFLSSPGGSVIDGAQLISAIRSVNKRIVCVTDFSASMSFVILQACDERVVLESSILMQHVASFGVRHQPEPNAVSFVNFLQSVTAAMDAAQAKRMQLPLERFKQLTRNDYWLFGADAVKAKAADRVAQVTCSPDLVNKEETQSLSFFGTRVVVKWSGCPLISNPKSVTIERFAPLTPRQEIEFNKKIQSVLDYKAEARKMIEEAMKSNSIEKDSE